MHRHNGLTTAEMMDTPQQALQSWVGNERGLLLAAAAALPAAVENSLQKIVSCHWWPFWVSASNFKMRKLFENEYHDGANQIRKDHKNM